MKLIYCLYKGGRGEEIFYLFIFLSLLIPQVYADQTDLPRGPLGKPDLNGVWQVLNSANYNLEAHSASAALAMIDGPVVPIPHPSVVRLGAVGSVPAGLGVVEGETIPYKKWALKQRDNNKKELAR
ncbi:MAG: hypothetical protein Ct9H300mP20_04230 [Gammaproteobacteria bacterium]|nr:MAG: hypothetical protein Ct9H300mP20_04230 [Gammaproteobacteria bacterium]